MTTKTTKIDTTGCTFEGDVAMERLVFAIEHTNKAMLAWARERKTWRGHDKAQDKARAAALAAYDTAHTAHIMAKFR